MVPARPKAQALRALLLFSLGFLRVAWGDDPGFYAELGDLFNLPYYQACVGHQNVGIVLRGLVHEDILVNLVVKPFGSR